MRTTRISRLRRAVSLVILPALLLSAAPMLAQEGRSGGDPISPDSADTIRASLERPPPKPPFGVLDAVGLPVRIVILPLRLIGTGFAKLVGFVTLPSARPSAHRIVLDAMARVGLRPAFGTIGPRSGQALLLRFVGARPLFAEVAYSIRQSQRHRAGLLLLGPEDRMFEVAYTFQRNAQPHFWGVGPDTEEEAKSDYLWDQQTVSAVGVTRAAVMRFRGKVAYEDNQVGRGFDDKVQDLQDNPEFAALFGVGERTRYFHADLSIALDLTHETGFQRRGIFIEVGSGLYRGVDDTDSDFHRFHLVLQGYAPLNPRQQLAFQILSEINREDSGQGIPFTHLAILGSSRGARSLNSTRFRDRDMAALMVEWRYEVWRELHERMRVENFVFFDTGGVKHRLTQLGFRDLVQSFGFGIRVMPGPRTRFVTYVALGDEGPRYRLLLNWAY